MYSQFRIIRAKFPSTCVACTGDIRKGDRIYWARGKRSHHVDCDTARLLHDSADNGCTACSGLGVRWNGIPCAFCDGTGSRECQERHGAIIRKRNANGDFVSPFVESRGGAA